MVKKIVLVVGLLGITGFFSPVYSQETKIISWVNCEMGDMVIRPLPWFQGGSWFGHNAIYFNSDSHGGGYDPFAVNPQMTNSDGLHSVIEAPGGERGVSVDTFYMFLDSKVYLGSYKSSNVTADDRRRLVKWAWFSRNCPYGETGTPGDEIKKPASENGRGDGRFRCDGLVEYCYEKIGMGFFTNEEESRCYSKLLFIKAKGWLPKFYPMAFIKKMIKEEAEAPQIVSTELWKGDKKVEEFNRLTGIVTVKVKVKDGEKGSGIDRVEFYHKDAAFEHLPPTFIDKDDGDKNDDGIPQEYSCQWNTDSIPNWTTWDVYARVYDRAGNTVGMV